MWKRFTHYFFVFSLLGFALLSAWQLNFSWAEIVRGLENIGQLIKFPQEELTANFWVITLLALWETLQIAYLGTFLGICISFPLVFLATKNITNPIIALLLRSFFGFLRATPALLWAIMAVIVVGLGPVAGTIAITLVTIGYFGKLATDALDSVPVSKTQALVATGANKMHLVRFVYWPVVQPKLLETALFLLEYNIRHSTILGVVGAGGIGFYISGYLKWLEYGTAFMLILVIFLVVILLEILSGRLKRYLFS